jgi:sulfite exporter TauE/SafE
MITQLGVLFMTGLLGSLGHCMGMCGPLVIMVGSQMQGTGWQRFWRYMGYHLARISIYVFLGAIVGVIGAVIRMGSDWHHIMGILSLILGVGVVIFGFGYLGWLPFGRLDVPAQRITTWISKVLHQGGSFSVLLLGGLNGLLPCGMVYGALMVAAATGNILSSAEGMLFFGLGTLPALLLVSLGSGLLGLRFRQTITRIAGIFMILIGIQLVLRGVAAFGWISHLHMGKLMLW